MVQLHKRFTDRQVGEFIERCRRPYQSAVFAQQEMSIRYIVIATNRKESAEDVVKWCHQRGGTVKTGSRN